MLKGAGRPLSQEAHVYEGTSLDHADSRRRGYPDGNPDLRPVSAAKGASNHIGSGGNGACANPGKALTAFRKQAGFSMNSGSKSKKKKASSDGLNDGCF